MGAGRLVPHCLVTHSDPAGWNNVGRGLQGRALQRTVGSGRVKKVQRVKKYTDILVI